MKQTDMFGETLEKKIYRMERWIARLQKEMWFLKEVYNLSKRTETPSKKAVQTDLFSA